MYYYVAMPQGQVGQYQNGDASMQQQAVPAVFGDASQMQGFNMGNQQYGFVQGQDSNGMAMQMGQAPTMMANGAAMGMGGQQVMVLMNMAPGQSNQMMEQGHGNWNQCGDSNGSNQNSGAMMQQQQQFQQQQQQAQQSHQQPQQQMQQLKSEGRVPWPQIGGCRS